MVPRTNEAPGLFSTTIGTFICWESCCISIRISTSGEPPGADGTMTRIGFSGYAACAKRAQPERMSAPSMTIVFFILMLLGRTALFSRNDHGDGVLQLP